MNRLRIIQTWGTILNVGFFDNGNAEDNVHRLKAGGEPSLPAPIPMWLAIRDAIRSTAAPGVIPAPKAPAPHEHIVDALASVCSATAYVSPVHAGRCSRTAMHLICIELKRFYNIAHSDFLG